MCLGGPATPIAPQRFYQGPEGARRRSTQGLNIAFVDVFNGEAAPQHLDKNLPELSGGQVVQEWIDDRAQVEEGVGHGEESDVAAEEGEGPVGLWHSSHH